MGCWNKTCGISKLPIFSGEKVYAFILEEQLTGFAGNDHHYPSSEWIPCRLPFVTRYNDYGGGEKSNWVLDILLEEIKEQMIELPAGTNSSHELEVTRDKLNEELFFDAVHEGRLAVPQAGHPTRINFVMMRKDIVDNILADYAPDFPAIAVAKTFDQMVEEIPAFYEDVIAASKDQLGIFGALRYGTDQIRDKYPQLYRCLIAFSVADGYSGIARLHTTVQQLHNQKKHKRAKEVIEYWLMGAVIDRFMINTRITWAPGGYEGSQDQDPEPYEILNKAIGKRLVKMMED